VASIDAAAESLSYAEARERVLAAVRPMEPVEAALEECRGRALRREIRSRHPLPPFHNSSMDGYAVRAADTFGTEQHSKWLPVVGVIPAGRTANRALGAGEAMRIMTGALLPPGADAVIPFEDVTRENLDTPEERVRIGGTAEPGQNVREAGRDVFENERVFEAGRELSPWDLALLASLGEARLLVGPRPRAVVLSTGDELLDAGEPLRPGAIRDGNRPMLVALLEETGLVIARSARVPDDPAKVGESIEKALKVADVVLTIGGISAGDFDPVKAALGGSNEIALWRVAMKPGRPQAFGTPHGRLFFGLPGNPASVACTFEALVRPALRKLMGHASLDRPRIRVKAAERIESRPGSVDFVRCTIEPRDDGWWAKPAGAQVSGHLAPQSRAHVLLVVPSGVAALELGESAEALVLRWPDPPAA
jgi:molybdopterin molybdotransferase